MPPRHKNWKGTLFLLCCLGVLKGFHGPSTLSLVDYVVENKNFTFDQMIYEVIPAIIPSLMLSFTILLMITDALNYKPIIVVGSICSVSAWVVLIWFYDSVTLTRVHQWIHGAHTAAYELAYYTYIYTQIDKSDYLRATAATHAAVLLGQFLSSLAPQILLPAKILTLPQLTYSYLGAAIATLLISLILPKVFDAVVDEHNDMHVYTVPTVPQRRKNQVFTTSEGDDYNRTGDLQTPNDAWYLKYRNSNGPAVQKRFFQKMKEAPTQSRLNFVHAYGNMRILKWCIWYASSYGVFWQAEAYLPTVLWGEMGGRKRGKWDGGVVLGVGAVFSAVVALIVWGTRLGRMFEWRKWDGYVLGGGSIVQGVGLLVVAKTADLYVAWGGWVVFVGVFHVLVVAVKAKIAEAILERSEAFIFGINSLMGSIIYASFTFVITSRFGLQLGIREQTSFLGGFALLLGIGFIILGILKWKKDGHFTPCAKFLEKGKCCKRRDGQAA